MRWTTRTTLVSVLLCGCGSGPSVSRPGTEAFQDEIDQWVAGAGHYGVEAAVVFADGGSWAGVAGLAGTGVALQSGDLISIASITKTMTGALVLQLADEGRLTLEDSVGRWLPPHANVDSGITLRQLLNHTSGVANYLDAPALPERIQEDPTHIFTTEELLGFVGPAQFPPGERTKYTNTAFLLLGLVAEAAGGKPILDLYRERLWGPLELTEFYYPGHEDAPPVGIAHALSGETVVDPLGHPALLTRGQSAAGLYSTARTVAAWGRALFVGDVLTPAMQAEMRTVVPAAGNIPGEAGAGLGIRSYGYLGRTQFGHSGGGVFGSSLMLFDPETGIAVAVVMNQSSGADHFILAPRLLEIATEIVR